jgi:hypothetical protein
MATTRLTRAFIAAESRRWGDIVRKTNIRMD